MRVFFALSLDNPLRSAASRAAADLQRGLAAARQPRAVKWVAHENLHITLRFLGEVDEQRMRKLLEGVRQPLQHSAFDLTIGGAGAFPSSGPPRVIWIGCGAGSESARAVFDLVEARVLTLGFEPERRSYTPHLTLGRVREIDRLAGRELREWLAAVPPSLGVQHVARVTLYQSHLSSAGPRYEVVTEAPLS